MSPAPRWRPLLPGHLVKCFEDLEQILASRHASHYSQGHKDQKCHPRSPWQMMPGHKPKRNCILLCYQPLWLPHTGRCFSVRPHHLVQPLEHRRPGGTEGGREAADGDLFGHRAAFVPLSAPFLPPPPTLPQTPILALMNRQANCQLSEARGYAPLPRGVPKPSPAHGSTLGLTYSVVPAPWSSQCGGRRAEQVPLANPSSASVGEAKGAGGLQELLRGA